MVRILFSAFDWLLLLQFEFEMVVNSVNSLILKILIQKCRVR